MNIFEKIQKIKVELLNCGLKKSGLNKYSGHSGFKYYELSDIMPDIIRLCDKYSVCTYIKYSDTKATLIALDSEKEGHERLKIFCPFLIPDVRGANDIQKLGAAQTYIRRYLYMSLFDIVEEDTFDAILGVKELKKQLEKYDKNKAKVEKNILDNYNVDKLEELGKEELKETLSKLKNKP